MRTLILGSAAILLSGCSFLGLNGATNHNSPAGVLGQFGSYGQSACNQPPSCNVPPVQYVHSGQYVHTGEYIEAQTVQPITQHYVEPHYAEPQYIQPFYVEPTQYVQQPSVQPVAAPKCHTGNCLARWNFEGAVGPVFAAGNNLITSSRTNDVAGTDFRSVSFNDAYDTGVRTELGGSYALSPNRKVSLLGHYEYADSAGVQDWGTINGQEFTGELTDYDSWGVELGLRQYFKPRRAIILDSIRPYVEARGGVSRVNDIGVKNTELGGAAFSLDEIPLYKDSWVPTAAGLVGVETPFTRYSTIGLETGVRYHGGLRTDKSVLGAGTQLGGLNNNRGRVSIPVTLRGRYRF